MMATAATVGQSDGKLYNVANDVTDAMAARERPLRCAANFRALAILQIVIGVVLFSLDCIGFGYGTQNADPMTGMGANCIVGAFVIAAGGLGLFVTRQPVGNVLWNAPLRSSLVTNIVVVVLSGGALLVMMVQLVSGYGCSYKGNHCLLVDQELVLGLRVTSVIVIGISLIAALLNAVFACNNFCRSETHQAQVIYIPVATGK